MKFLHTADWQIGMKASHVGTAGDRVRRERIVAIDRVVGAAREHAVDFMLIAGDLFEDNGVDRVLVQTVADRISGAGVPAYIIPGNHDPLVPGSVWEHPAWTFHPDIHVLRESEPIDVPGGILYPCPLRAKHGRRDPTAWVEPVEGDAVRIGLAHGTVEGVDQDEAQDYPIPRDAAVRAGLDYLALGHWHSTARYDVSGITRAAYSGTHEPTKFGERDSGNVLTVQIDAPGAPPAIEQVVTGGLTWRTIDAELNASGEGSRVREEIETMDKSSDTLLRVQLDGLLFAEDRDELVRMREVLESRFLFGSLDSDSLTLSPTDSEWIDRLPAGIVREAGERLRALSDPNHLGPRSDGAAPEIAAQALLVLYNLAAGEEQ